MSEAMQLQVLAKFTQDLIASESTPCQCCPDVIIHPGEKRYFVQDPKRPNMPGKYVCKACMLHYANKAGTTARIVPTATKHGPNDPTMSANRHAVVDMDAIQSLVNQSQRHGVHTTLGKATAMPPPTSTLPVVQNPSFFQNYFSGKDRLLSMPSESVKPAIGYSASHVQYADERQRWATSSYKGRPSTLLSGSAGQLPRLAQVKDQVHIVVYVFYESLSEKTVKMNIKEGMPVDYSISPQSLIETIKSNLVGPLTEFCPGFPWDFSSRAMKVREVSIWQDLDQADPSHPYFYGRFLKKKTGAKSDGSFIFSQPRGAVDFALIIKNQQWLRVEEHKDVLAQNEVEFRVPEFRVAKLNLTSDTLSKRKTPPSPDKKSSLTSSSALRRKMANSESDLIRTSESDQVTHTWNQQFQFKPLNLEEVRKGIFLGGQSAILAQKKQIDAEVNEVVTCYLIDAVPFDDLCNINGDAKIIDNNKKYRAVLSFDTSKAFIGTGSFKTASFAQLKWTSTSDIPKLGLGANMTESAQGLRIALKCPYHTTPKMTGIKRFNFADESRKVLTEGTLLGWADSLLRFSYGFIDDFISAQLLDPPFSIPRLRFIQAAIAYPDPTLHRASAYLLEELIPVDLPFIKYIHNSEAAPLQDENEPGYDLGVFLCFIQHVQFTITHGQVYLSDFQGAENLLTDPQVMTHPSLVEEEHFRNLFGESNVKKAFGLFTSQHKCNKYCQWFELESFSSVHTEDSS